MAFSGKIVSRNFIAIQLRESLILIPYQGNSSVFYNDVLVPESPAREYTIRIGK